MDQFLYGIPVIGLVFQLIGYLIAVLPIIAPITYSAAVPIAFARAVRRHVRAVGRRQHRHRGHDAGRPRSSAGRRASSCCRSSGERARRDLRRTPALLDRAGPGGPVRACSCRASTRGCRISVRADQIISGTIINIAAFGITGYLNTLLAKSSPTGAGAFTAWTPPAFLTDLPVVGWLFAMFLAQGPITMSASSFVVDRLPDPAVPVALGPAHAGPSASIREAAETVGIDVIRLRYRNVLLGGVLAGLGGAFLSMEATASFQPGMTAGRGFIGLAAMIVGRWTPIGRVRCRAAVRVVGRHRPVDQDRSAAGPARRHPDLAAGPVLRRAAVPRHDRHPGRRRRAEHPAGGRRPAVRARGRDLTREERDRAAAYLDLEEGRGPVPVLDDAGIERVLRATRRIAVVGASADRAGRRTASSATWSSRASSACRSTRTSATSSASRPTRPWPRRSPRPGPFDMVDVFRRSELCVPHAEEAVATGARSCGSSSASSTGRRRAIAHDGGLEVVMDRCTAIEWRRIAGR